MHSKIGSHELEGEDDDQQDNIILRLDGIVGDVLGDEVDDERSKGACLMRNEVHNRRSY